MKNVGAPLLKFKENVVILIIFLGWANINSQPKSHSNFIKSYALRYNLTRTVVSQNNSKSEEIITNGLFYGSENYSTNLNSRVLYIRENSKCLILTKAPPKTLTELDTTKAKTFLFAEPANDIFLLLNSLSSFSKSDERNDRVRKEKYFIGNKARSIDSIYITYLTSALFPDNIIYISKRTNDEYYLKDSLKITFIDTLPRKPNNSTIQQYLKSDSIKKYFRINLN